MSDKWVKIQLDKGGAVFYYYDRVIKDNNDNYLFIERSDTPVKPNCPPFPEGRTTVDMKPGQTICYTFKADSGYSIFWWDCQAGNSVTVKRVDVVGPGGNVLYTQKAHTGTIYCGPKGPHAIVKPGNDYQIRVSELGNKPNMAVTFNFWQ